MPTTVISQRLRMSKTRERERERELNIYMLDLFTIFRPSECHRFTWFLLAKVLDWTLQSQHFNHHKFTILIYKKRVPNDWNSYEINRSLEFWWSENSEPVYCVLSYMCLLCLRVCVCAGNDEKRSTVVKECFSSIESSCIFETHKHTRTRNLALPSLCAKALFEDHYRNEFQQPIMQCKMYVCAEML